MKKHDRGTTVKIADNRRKISIRAYLFKKWLDLQRANIRRNTAGLNLSDLIGVVSTGQSSEGKKREHKLESHRNEMLLSERKNNNRILKRNKPPYKYRTDFKPQQPTFVNRFLAICLQQKKTKTKGRE